MNGPIFTPEIDAQLRATRSVTVEGDIIRVVFKIRELDEKRHVRSVALLLQDLEKIFADNPDKNFYGLADLTPLANQISYMSEEIRDGYARIIDHPRITKIALFGANVFFEVATNIIINTTGRRDKTHMFKTEAEALEWLRN